jgi:hypothetical protein
MEWLKNLKTFEGLVVIPVGRRKLDVRVVAHGVLLAHTLLDVGVGRTRP